MMNNNFNHLGLTGGLGGSNFRIMLVSGGGCRRFPPLVCRITSTNVRPASVSFPFHGVFRRQGSFCFQVTRMHTVFPRGGVVRASVKGTRCSCLILTTNAAAGFFNGGRVRRRTVPVGGISRTVKLQGTLLTGLRQTLAYSAGRRRRRLLGVIVMNKKTANMRITNMLSRVGGFMLPGSCPSVPTDLVRICLIRTKPQLLTKVSRSSSTRTRGFLHRVKIGVLLGGHIISCHSRGMVLRSNDRVTAHAFV